MNKVAIIGAGLSGLTAARELTGNGFEVRLFDKSRGPGGRMATRRAGSFAFDHGAQYFTARDDRFQRQVDVWIEEGMVLPWQVRLAEVQAGKLTPKMGDIVRYVGAPRMSALTRHLSTGLEIQYQTLIEHVRRAGDQWRLVDDKDSEMGRYDAVLITTPPEQAVPLLAESSRLAMQANAVSMLPCWAVMVAFEKALALAYEGLFINDAALSWAARNTSKPGRGPQESWVLHGSPSWSIKNLEADKDVVADQLLDTFFETTGLEPVAPLHLQAHRWRYALAENPLDDGCLWEDALRIGVCGDWCKNSRVEGAFLSGMAAADRVSGISD